MERRRQALLALFLVSLMPTTSILFAYSWSDSELAGQAFFVFAKLWIIAIPIYWLYRVEAGNFSIRKLLGLDSLTSSSRNEAIISGLGMFAIIAGTYAVLGDSVDVTLMKEEIGATGLLNPTTFFLGAIYWITLNSLVEEFVFRQFVGDRLLELTGSNFASVAGSAIVFTLHHTVALTYYFALWQNTLATIAILGAGAIWSILWLRHRSLAACWISHAIADVAVFGVAYLILF
ncbi:MAG: CPBP family intramembrane metalloprotease [Candidatus Thalassarchaeaceae archaeon]|nr:CPBP family intramembrane metalloprotease [Candidatus Thalassarchaeaceae archaeon]